MLRQSAARRGSIDTAGDLAGVALCEGETLLAEVTWRTKQSHSRELLPTLDWLLPRHGRSKSNRRAIVCLGPGRMPACASV